MRATRTLYRPVGREELELLRESGWRRFPPRLPDQPIFYPVVQRDYAVKIARDWNAARSGAGYVTRFEVDAAWLSRFEEREVGGSAHTPTMARHAKKRPIFKRKPPSAVSPEARTVAHNPSNNMSLTVIFLSRWREVHRQDNDLEPIFRNKPETNQGRGLWS